MIKVAILGYGTVGSGVFEIINENKELITANAGEEIDVKYVLDLREFPGDSCESVLVHDYNIILNDPEVEVVIEVMGGLKRFHMNLQEILINLIHILRQFIHLHLQH